MKIKTHHFLVVSCFNFKKASILLLLLMLIASISADCYAYANENANSSADVGSGSSSGARVRNNFNADELRLVGKQILHKKLTGEELAKMGYQSEYCDVTLLIKDLHLAKTHHPYQLLGGNIRLVTIFHTEIIVDIISSNCHKIADSKHKREKGAKGAKNKKADIYQNESYHHKTYKDGLMRFALCEEATINTGQIIKAKSLAWLSRKFCLIDIEILHK